MPINSLHINFNICVNMYLEHFGVAPSSYQMCYRVAIQIIEEDIQIFLAN